METWLNLNGVVLNECLTSLIVTLRLDALNLSKKLTEELTEAYEVVNNDLCLAILLNKIDNILIFALLVAPLSDKLTVTHVRLLDILTELDA